MLCLPSYIYDNNYNGTSLPTTYQNCAKLFVNLPYSEKVFAHFSLYSYKIKQNNPLLILKESHLLHHSGILYREGSITSYTWFPPALIPFGRINRIFSFRDTCSRINLSTCFASWCHKISCATIFRT